VVAPLVVEYQEKHIMDKEGGSAKQPPMHPLMKALDKSLTKERMGGVIIWCLYAVAVVDRLRKMFEELAVTMASIWQLVAVLKLKETMWCIHTKADESPRRCNDEERKEQECSVIYAIVDAARRRLPKEEDYR
jgi:hypothetical protein